MRNGTAKPCCGVRRRPRPIRITWARCEFWPRVMRRQDEWNRQQARHRGYKRPIRFYAFQTCVTRSARTDRKVLPDTKRAFGSLACLNDHSPPTHGPSRFDSAKHRPSFLHLTPTVTKLQLVINLKNRKGLGIAVSLPLLGRADEVFE